MIIKVQWNNKHYSVNHIPDQCPHCHLKIKPIIVGVYENVPHTGIPMLEILYACVNQNCLRSFIASYEYIGGGDTEYHYIGSSFGTPQEKRYSDQITTISSSFQKIYNEAYFSEQHKLLEICGVGYRKALEFLIKDYCISLYPDKEEEIKRKFLGQCIGDHVSDNRIKSVCKRATWLGNDETHYVKRWEEKNLSDLKKLIDLTVHWIEMELLTQSFEDEMPD